MSSDAPDIRNRGLGFAAHPPGLTTLYFTELWERFSYYGMRALLILFMVAPVEAGGLGFNIRHDEVDAVPAHWGSVKLRACDYPGGRLVGLPHLSRYALFSKPETDWGAARRRQVEMAIGLSNSMHPARPGGAVVIPAPQNLP